MGYLCTDSIPMENCPFADTYIHCCWVCVEYATDIVNRNGFSFSFCHETQILSHTNCRALEFLSLKVTRHRTYMIVITKLYQRASIFLFLHSFHPLPNCLSFSHTFSLGQRVMLQIRSLWATAKKELSLSLKMYVYVFVCVGHCGYAGLDMLLGKCSDVIQG